MRFSRPLIAVGLACSTTLAAAPATTNDRQAPLARIEVQNDRKVPVTVFIERGSFDVRVGVVGPLQTSTLALPDWIANQRAEVAIFVHPEGGRDLVSEHLTVHSGALLGLHVPVGDFTVMPTPPADTMSAVLTSGELNATTLTVNNPLTTAVTVYIEQGTFDIRVGTVAPQSTATLRLPEWLIKEQQTLEFFVHPQGGQDLASSRLEVRPGAHLGLRVPAQ